MSVVPQGHPDRVGFEPDRPQPFTPYIAPETSLSELTPRAVIVGTILGMIFGASSLYLVLKVGLTVSASIPVAVISITLFRILSKMGARNATILENNISQTAGSAGESIAFGVGVTMPAILILGFDLEIGRVMLVAVLGGLLGILMMIPLRRALIVAQHGLLKYPEGTACAEVLKAGASDESRAAASEEARLEQEARGGASTSAKTIFTGFGIGLVYKTAMVAFRTWKDTPQRIFGRPFEGASIAAEISPELLGVGYIIGPRIAGIMCAGGALAYLVLIPTIKFFGQALTEPLAPATTGLIRDMDPNAIRNEYILYIGAGAVAAGGIISVFKALPMIWHGIKGGMRDVSAARAGDTRAAAPRTDRDLSIKLVLIGIIALIVIIAFSSPLYVGGTGIAARIGAALLIIVFGFLFVTVSSRLTGEVGSTSNPISGMTVATLLLTCLVFVILGWTGSNYFVTALSIGAIVCIASSNGGTTSQDLKTGFLVGATPKNQQIAILIGALASALLLGPILLGLNETGSVYVPVNNVPAGYSAGSYKQGDVVDTKAFHGTQQAGVLLHGGTDPKSYNVWFRNDPSGGNAEKYLVDESGTPVYYVDPGINGAIRKLPDGREVAQKFDAPKATLMSYIIKGILGGELPWGLVLIGAMIAIVLELSSIPSLAFAVGVYLPLSSTTPILIGGIIRWSVDKWIAKKHAGAKMTEEQLVAEGDKSPGVLMASGYIAGGAIAGIVIAFVLGVSAMRPLNEAVGRFAENNPFATGPNADLWSLIPFIALIALLWLTGREKILAHRDIP
ncbi:MAG TPA: oligopeptide transporter, OPT family [Thermoanaerobaculia bacterium]|nr:oligopeptide transporter, OPT family [Thermoanaerobaculia bacterium]